MPLPWTAEGGSFGFGDGGTHLPQPAWFADHAVSVQEGTSGSTLSLHREALELRRALQTEERLEWIETGRADVLGFHRPNGWRVITNFGTEPFHLGNSNVLLPSTELIDGALPHAATAWLAASEAR